jgi:hypothetical protein
MFIKRSVLTEKYCMILEEYIVPDYHSSVSVYPYALLCGMCKSQEHSMSTVVKSDNDRKSLSLCHFCMNKFFMRNIYY